MEILKEPREYAKEVRELGFTKEEFLEAIGKRVKTVPQIKINSKLIGGYNQLVEYFADKGKVNFKGEIINE